MVGWSRRGRESRERRRRWWDSLTEDQKDESRMRESKFDLAFMELVPWLIFFLVFMAAFMIIESYRRGQW